MSGASRYDRNIWQLKPQVRLGFKCGRGLQILLQKGLSSKGFQSGPSVVETSDPLHLKKNDGVNMYASGVYFVLCGV